DRGGGRTVNGRTRRSAAAEPARMREDMGRPFWTQDASCGGTLSVILRRKEMARHRRVRYAMPQAAMAPFLPLSHGDSLMRRLSWSLAAVVFVAAAGGARADLPTYIKKDEPKFAWKLKNKTAADAGTTYELELVSQEWHDITWKHRIDVFVPKDVKPNATMLIYNTGGYNAGYPLFGFELATKIKAPARLLYDIPNQPLFDGKKEDALIAETFVRALETKDTTWPLLFPMAKSVVKALDALQAFTKDEFKEPATRFVLTGGS